MPYSLCDVVYNNSTVGIPVVHGSQALVSLLSSSVPYLVFDRGCVIEGNCLREEGGSDG